MVNNTRRIILCNSAVLSKDIFNNNLETNKTKQVRAILLKQVYEVIGN